MQNLPDLSRTSHARTPAQLRARRDRDALARMLRLMPSDHRRIIEMVILNRRTHRDAAAELRMVPGVLSRRLQRLRNQLACPMRRALSIHLDTLPEPTHGIAIDHFFGGVKCYQIAKSRNLTEREVQAHVDYIRGWIRALNRRALAQRRALEAQLAERDE